MYQPKNLLVTGGAGFIGSNFINYIRKFFSTPIRIINLDKLDYCSNKEGVDYDEFIHCDLSKDREKILNCLQEYNIDTIVHFAAQTHVDNSFGNSLEFTLDNIYGTHQLLECCREYKGIQRFIHISTDEVYGEIALDEQNCTETSLLNPTNPYAATKAGAEFIVRSYYYSFKLPVMIIRANNVYGPRQYPEKVIPKFILQALHNQPFTIQGTGETRRNFIYVTDVADAILKVLFYGNFNHIYNIGCSNEHSVLDIARILLKQIRPNESLEKCIVFIPDRNFNDYRYAISSKKLRELGWSEQVSFETGILETIKWYSEQLD